MPSRLPPPSPPLTPPPLLPSSTPQPLTPRPLPPSTAPPHDHHSLTGLLPAVIAAAVSLSFLLLLLPLLLLLLVFLRRRYSLPPISSDPTPPLRLSYSFLRRATSSFSPSLRLGQGGSGAVFSATLPTKGNAKIPAAVKLMDSGSLQGEREFHNEILMASKLVGADRVVRLLGFASEERRRRMCLVYELMEMGNLQECLLHKKSEQLMDWGHRFRVAVDVARALAYLHHECDPPIVHGDVKPSNVLLDGNFRAKIADFGLARFKLVDHHGESGRGSKVERRDGVVEINANADDTGSIGETESVATTVGFDEASAGLGIGVDRSPELNLPGAGTVPSPEIVHMMKSPVDYGGGREGVLEEHAGEGGKGNGKEAMEKGFRKLSSVKVKDYVMEWIGSEVRKAPPNGGWIGGSSSKSARMGKVEKEKAKKRPQWWVSMDEENGLKETKRKTVREWWKEEYVEELDMKKRKKRKKKKKRTKMVPLSDGDLVDWWPRDDGEYRETNKCVSRMSGHSNIGWWLNVVGGDAGMSHGASCDSASGEMLKSGGCFSSTPSMRGTMCYIAPEYGSGGDLSEKCDVYSYGVFLLVLVAGRRPLQVTSRMSEYQRASLISWARKLSRKGKVLDLVDKKIQSLDKEQAELCITVALVCLQKSPGCRPTMKEVVGMLTGELDSPAPPTEFSTSHSSRFPLKSQKI